MPINRLQKLTISKIDLNSCKTKIFEPNLNNHKAFILNYSFSIHARNQQVAKLCIHSLEMYMSDQNLKNLTISRYKVNFGEIYVNPGIDNRFQILFNITN